MKKFKAVAAELAERLELPSEALGAARLTLTAGSRLLVENHAGVQEYSPEQILVSCGRGRIIISGSGLSIQGMNASELAVKGSIQTVEWEK